MMVTIQSDAGHQLLAWLNASGEARFVGGCVRDSLMNLPVNDIDIATTLPPEQTITVLHQHAVKVIPTGIAHGTVTAIVDGQPFEITTLRKDVNTDGRHAEVDFTDSWEEDAARRDFTMNAMSVGADGQLHDYFDGTQDAHAGKVRFVGGAAQRIAEDYLRILRLFRFYACVGKQPPDDDTLAACAEASHGIDGLSGERVQYEMFRLMGAEKIVKTLGFMQQTGVLQKVLLTPQQLNLGPFKRLKTIEHNLGVSPSAFVRFSMLLRANSLENHMPLLQARWKLSNRNMYYINELLAAPLLPKETPVAVQKEMLRKLGAEVFSRHVVQSWALQDEGAYHVEDEYSAMLKLATNWQAPIFPISGRDVLTLGVASGAQVGALLKQAEEYWVARDYKADATELLNHIRPG